MIFSRMKFQFLPDHFNTLIIDMMARSNINIFDMRTLFTQVIESPKKLNSIDEIIPRLNLRIG